MVWRLRLLRVLRRVGKRRSGKKRVFGLGLLKVWKDFF